jgi:hypothetical protein
VTATVPLVHVGRSMSDLKPHGDPFTSTVFQPTIVNLPVSYTRMFDFFQSLYTVQLSSAKFSLDRIVVTVNVVLTINLSVVIILFNMYSYVMLPLLCYQC